jgi:hypothetical protein
MAEMTWQEKAERLWDIHECENLMGRYEYFHTAHLHRKTADLFALDADDLWVEVVGMGVFTGRRGVEAFFDEWHRSLDGDPRGSLNIHTLTTPVIEVARDGKTAKAVWMSPGLETRTSRRKGGLAALWNWGKYAVDFLKVDGKWYFWHFTITNDILCHYDTSWVDTGSADDGDLMYHAGKPAPDRPNTFVPDFYGVEKVKKLYPVPPEPYDTY